MPIDYNILTQRQLAPAPDIGGVIGGAKQARRQRIIDKQNQSEVTANRKILDAQEQRRLNTHTISAIGSTLPKFKQKIMSIRERQDLTPEQRNMGVNQATRSYLGVMKQGGANISDEMLNAPMSRKLAFELEQYGNQYNALSKQNKLNQTVDPSSVREYEYYSKLDPAQKQAYLEMKRAEKTYMGNIKGAPTIIRPPTAGGKMGITPLSTAEEEVTAKATEAGAVQKAKTEAQVEASGTLTPKEKKEEGQEKLTKNIDTMRDLFKDLKNAPLGIVDLDKSSWSNIGSKLASSGVGQAVQSAIGTKAQVARNSIKLIKPTLINHVRSATGMGAKGMDSEKELEFYLTSVGNEKTDFQSNMLALKLLDENFGVMGRNGYEKSPNLNMSDIKYEDISPEFKGMTREQVKKKLLSGQSVKKKSTRTEAVISGKKKTKSGYTIEEVK